MALPPDRVAISNLKTALGAVFDAVEKDPTPTVIRRVKTGLAEHFDALETLRTKTEPVTMPRATFDPADPKAIGRVVSIALLAQPRVPLGEVRNAYGSGVYAIYYEGDHPLYAGITRTETPIYVGKADPAADDASNPREQGPKLTGRLIEHANTIRVAAAYADKLPAGLSPIRLDDFVCRRLVCATNAQLVAEKHLISTFWPLWNQETKTCWGMSKHGDAAKTRKNKRSPWDVVHPGRAWALDALLENSLEPAQIEEKVAEVLAKYPPRKDHAELLEEMLAGFRQDDGAPKIETVPPVGEDAQGPEPDEAGEEDPED